MAKKKIHLGGSKSMCRLLWLGVITYSIPWMAECFVPLHTSNSPRCFDYSQNTNNRRTLALSHNVPFLARRPRSRRRRRSVIDKCAAAAAADSDNDGDLSSFDWSTAIQNQDDNDDNVVDNKQREAENIYIPKGGISISDEIEASQRDKFQTEVVPIKGLSRYVTAAQLITTSMNRDSFEPVRYLISLSSSSSSASAKDDDDDKTAVPTPENVFVMVDVPPYSPRLVAQMQAFMRDSSSSSSSRLAAILITSRDAIHYDEAPGAFAVRRSHVVLWKQAFPDIQIVAYRLDIPRDCRTAVTQVLDGQGPFGAGSTSTTTTTTTAEDNGLSFVEMGRPLTYEAWDYHTAQQVLRGEKPPPDDSDDAALDQVGSATTASTGQSEKSNNEYSVEAIRLREAERSVLAVFTPGHTFGSLSFIFPQLNLCCSGYCIPVEDNRSEEQENDEGGSMFLGDGGGAGPALDVRGYITTSRAGISRQMESAKKLVKTYSDRFHTVLPSRGDPLFLDEDNIQEREAELLAIIKQYKRIGEIYDQLGITSKEGESNDSQ